MKKLFAVFFVGTILSGCDARDPIPEKTTQVGDGYELSLLFTHDGCNMYRFEDSHHYRYWSDCRGQVDYRVQDGKTTRPDSVQTVH